MISVLCQSCDLFSSTLVDAESSPTLVSSGRSDKIVSCQEGRSSQIDRSSEKTTSTEEAKPKEKPTRKPGMVLLQKHAYTVGKNVFQNKAKYPANIYLFYKTSINLQ